MRHETHPITYYCKRCCEPVVVTLFNGVIRACGHDDAPVIGTNAHELKPNPDHSPEDSEC